MIMTFHPCVCLASALLFVTLSLCQGTVQDLWISPAPPDFATNLTVGEVFTIRWDTSLAGSLSIYAPSADASNVDLWITDYNLHIYSKRIAGPSARVQLPPSVPSQH